MLTREQAEGALSEITTLADAGAIAEAQAALLKNCRRGVPDSHAAGFATYARLVDLPLVGVRLLSKIVRPPRGTLVKASDAERATYASCLIEIGASREGQELLKTINPVKARSTFFFLALAARAEWDWEACVSHLVNYLKNPRDEGVSLVAAKLWLGGAFLRGKGNNQRSRVLLEEVLRRTAEMRHSFLHNRALEFIVEGCFLERNWPALGRALVALESSTHASDAYYALIIRQWRVMGSLFDPRARKQSLSALDAIRNEFMKMEKWEEARGCDFFRAVAMRDRALLLKLYFGSPYPALRRKIAKLLGDVPAIFERHEGTKTPRHFVDVATGLNSYGSAFLKPDQALARLLAALSSDFYRPLQLAQLHEALYPGDHFNPDSSPDRVHQILRRLRDWLKKGGIPLEISEAHGFYSLRLPGDLALRIASDPGRASALFQRPLAPRIQKRLGVLTRKFRGHPFSAAEAAKAVGVSYRSMVYNLNEAVTQDVLDRTGSGPSTRYRLKRS